MNMTVVILVSCLSLALAVAGAGTGAMAGALAGVVAEGLWLGKLLLVSSRTRFLAGLYRRGHAGSQA